MEKGKRGRDTVGNQTPGSTHGKREGQHKHGEMRGLDTGYLHLEDEFREHLALKTNGA